MRFSSLAVLSFLLTGCAAVSESDEPDNPTTYRPAQANIDTYPDGLDYKGVPSDEAPKIGADLRAQENGAAEAKVVGGTKVDEGEFLDTVGVGSLVEDEVCSGVLIEQDVVLTAAHCVTAGYSARVLVGRDTKNWRAEYEVFGFEHGFMSEHLPEECNQNRPKCALDIAVLVLKNPVQNVAPRAFAPDALIDDAISYRAVGFGRLDRDARLVSRYKREARITAASNNCRGVVRSGPGQSVRSDEDVYGCEPGQEIVAGQMRGRTDTCNGDSGGPLFLGPLGTGQAGSNDEFLLAALTSRASSQSETACGDGGVYERLNSDAQRWIADAITRIRARPKKNDDA